MIPNGGAVLHLQLPAGSSPGRGGAVALAGFGRIRAWGGFSSRGGLGVVWRLVRLAILLLAVAVAGADACGDAAPCAAAEGSRSEVETPAPSLPLDGNSPCVCPSDFALFLAPARHESPVGGELRQPGPAALLRPEHLASQGVTPAWLSGVDPLYPPASPRLHALLGVWLL
jgi:hypothetical protein